jgi:hypothetical protein
MLLGHMECLNTFAPYGEQHHAATFNYHQMVVTWPLGEIDRYWGL